MGYIESNEGVHMDICGNSILPCEHLHWIQCNLSLMKKKLFSFCCHCRRSVNEPLWFIHTATATTQKFKYFCFPLPSQCEHLHLLPWYLFFPLPLPPQLGIDPLHDDTKILKIMSLPSQCERALNMGGHYVWDFLPNAIPAWFSATS